MSDITILPGNYVVLGASGLIGYHLLNLLKDKENVNVLATYNERDVRVTAKNIRCSKVNLLDAQECNRIIKGADYVFCAAGIVASTPVLEKDPVKAIQINLQIAVNCIEAAWRFQIKHFVWFSSTTGYPANNESTISEDEMFNADPPENWFGLGWMTRYVEKFAFHLSENLANPLTFTALRPSLVYGENDHFNEQNAHFLPAIIKRVVLRESPLQIWGCGEQKRDVIHGHDVARAAIIALKRSSGYRAYNIADGCSYSINQIVELICELDNFDTARIDHLLDKKQNVKSRKFDTELAEKELDFKIEISLYEGLKRTISWYRKSIFSTENKQGYLK